MANVSGQRSRSVSVDVGLKILGNFLQGFGVPSAGITAKFDKATEVAFTFSNVHRAYYDPGYAGKLLAGRKLDKQNPAARPFFDANHCNMLLVDSTITSTDFTIDVTETSEQGIELDIPAIQQIVKGVSAGVDVKSSSKLSVTFGGTKPLAFAFSCCPVVTDPVDGTIRTFRPTPGIDAIGEGEEGEKADIGEPVLLSEEPEMLSIADAEATVEAK
jgi:hypothetical protein